MLLVVNKYLFRKRFVGITLWPFVFMKYADLKRDSIFINHERIHLRQQLELLILPFFIWYVIEYGIRLLQYKDRYEAYRNISFEREAYINEGELHYLKQRPFWRFLSYI